MFAAFTELTQASTVVWMHLLGKPVCAKSMLNTTLKARKQLVEGCNDIITTSVKFFVKCTNSDGSSNEHTIVFSQISQEIPMWDLLV